MSGRRRFLKHAGVAATGLMLPGCDTLFWPDLRAVAGAMAGLLNRRGLATRTGERYLRVAGTLDNSSVETLTARILESIGMDAARMTWLSVDGLRDALAEKIREDFARENTSRVDGWILARTECLLCAVAYLQDEGEA